LDGANFLDEMSDHDDFKYRGLIHAEEKSAEKKSKSSVRKFGNLTMGNSRMSLPNACLNVLMKAILAAHMAIVYNSFLRLMIEVFHFWVTSGSSNIAVIMINFIDLIEKFILKTVTFFMQNFTILH
jgi:hypothetical protein